MRYRLFFVLTLFAVLGFETGRPAQASWCAHYRNGGTNCGFQTFEQCLATVSGVGGMCNPNFSDAPSRVQREPAHSEQRVHTKLPAKVVREKNETKKEAVRRPKPPSEGKPVAAEKPASVEKPAALAIDDDDHIIPAEPEMDQPAQAVGNPVVASPMGPALAPNSDFIAARDLVLSGNYQAGLTALQNLNQDNDADVAAYIGFANSKLGRTTDAKSWYEKALALDPNHLWALSYYGILLADEGNLRQARENLDKIKTACGGTGCYAYSTLQAAIGAKKQ